MVLIKYQLLETGVTVVSDIQLNPLDRFVQIHNGRGRIALDVLNVFILFSDSSERLLGTIPEIQGLYCLLFKRLGIGRGGTFPECAKGVGTEPQLCPGGEEQLRKVGRLLLERGKFGFYAVAGQRNESRLVLQLFGLVASADELIGEIRSCRFSGRSRDAKLLRLASLRRFLASGSVKSAMSSTPPSFT